MLARRLTVCCLAQIDLSFNQLCGIDRNGDGAYRAEGITAIADALRVSRSLTFADLRKNDLDDAAKQMLHESVKGRVGFKLYV